ncbi:GntP family permease [Anaerotruncus colihominis]|uniref:GntP family permease n=1 Tax=Anaerotruncus colihominis TaxID=169435 RepID=UPI0034A5826C
MNEVISIIGIFVALGIIVVGSLKNLNLIILSSIAAFIVAGTGSVGLIGGYSTYLGGVANSIISMFPLFLGGQLLGCFLEATGMTESIANAIIRKSGTKAIVLAVFTVSWILVFCGINVFVIIFTVYPLACAFFKVGDIPRSLIPACVLGACVSQQSLPGVTTNANILSTEAFGIPAAAGPITGITVSAFLFIANGYYLHRQAQKARERGEHFVPLPDESFDVDLNKAGLPHPALVIAPIGVVLVALNVFAVPAYASLYLGAIVCLVLFWKRLGGVSGTIATLNKAAKSSQSVVSTCAIIGFSSIVTAVPGYNLLLKGLEKISGGNPYIFAFVAVAAIAAVSGSATGGVRFVLDSFKDTLLAMGGRPASLVRVICVSSLTFDSMPHNSAIVLTLNACNVTHKEGYKHLAVTTVLNTTIAAIIAIIFAMIGIQ